MTTIPTSIDNQTMKVKRPREGGFCVTLFFRFCSVMCPFPFTFLSSPQIFLIPKNLVITFKISTIEGFYHKVNYFSIVLVFFSFVIVLKK